MSDTRKQYKYLYHDPCSSYKQLRVKGTHIFARYFYGQTLGEDARTPQQLAVEFELPLEAILEAVEYCESNPSEIAEDFAEEERLMEAHGMNDPNYKYHGQPKLLTIEERKRLGLL